MLVALLLPAACEETPTLPDDLEEHQAETDAGADDTATAATQPAETRAATEPASVLEWPTPPEDPPEIGPHDGLLYPLPDGIGRVEWKPDARQIYLLTMEGKALQVDALRAYAPSADGPVEIPLHTCEAPTSAGETCYHHEPLPAAPVSASPVSSSLLLRMRAGNRDLHAKLILPADRVESNENGSTSSH